MWIIKKIINSGRIPLLIFHVFFFFIVLANFPIGKFFIGWDAVSPELNFPVNFQRSLFAGWQENYGLGTLGGHGFASLLPHSIITYIISLIFPVWAVRSVFTFLCLYLGGLGLYFLAGFIFHKITVEEYQKKFSTAIEYICLLTALFYILNLATVQMFYLQLEAFIVHFAALPWLFWIIFRLAGETNRKNLTLFFIINFFASTQGFIPPLFVVYVISLTLFVFVYMLVNRFKWVAVKKSLLVLFLTSLVNAYWLLPFGYYQITNGGLTQIAYNNLITTDDFILKNKKYGNLENVALMKGFSFDMQELGGYVFQPWIEHYSKSEIKIIGYSLFVFVLASALLSLILIRHVLVKISAVIFLYFLASLATDSPLFSLYTRFMQTLSHSYYQAFRTAFTKFASGYSFLFSLFLGLGLYILLGYTYRLLKHKLISLSVFFGLFFLIIYYAFPVFKGNLLYKKLQVNIPQAYFEVMDFFKNQKDGRIADFPQDCAEGWYGYQWGYFGSGFYWYGIKQPILARTFDVWSPNNENYYWEIVQAIRSQDYGRVDKLIQKYDAKWILYDPNLIHCRTARGFIQFDEFVKYFENSPNYRLVRTFISDNLNPIRLFEKVSVETNTFVSLEQNLPFISPGYKWNNYDRGFEEYGNYISDSSTIRGVPSTLLRATSEVSLGNQIYYPFRSSFTGRKQEELEFGVKDYTDYWSFTARIPTDLVGGKLIIPVLDKNEITQVDENDLSLVSEKLPEIYLDGELIQIPPPDTDSSTSEESELRKLSLPPSEVLLGYIKEGNLEIRVPKIKGYYSYNLPASPAGGQPTTYNLQLKNCDQFNQGFLSHEKVTEDGKDWLRLTSIGSSNCLDFDLPKLTQRIGYLATVESRNIEGKSLLFSIINNNSQRADLETYLPRRLSDGVSLSYFIIPPMEEYGLGYTLHLDNISIGRVKTVNDLGNITVNPIPYRFLTGMKIEKHLPGGVAPAAHLEGGNIEVVHPNPSYYKVMINSSTPGESLGATPGVSLSNYLILSQSFDEGWRAYEIKDQRSKIKNFFANNFPFLFEKELKDHVLVNNWENGWNINLKDQNSNIKNNIALLEKTIVIVYLPQYLEYLGFGMMGICTLFLIFSKHLKFS